MPAITSPCRTPSQSLQEYGRGAAGGLMFSLPLLFTMEVWWASFILHPVRLLAYVAATFAVLLAYNRFAGLRRDATWWECAIDSVEEMGVGLVLSALVLWLMGRLEPPSSGLEIVGKIVMEAMTVAIGVSVGTAQLGGAPDEEESNDSGMEGGDGCQGSEEPPDFISQMAIAFCGAVLFAANVAPTEEILVMAEETAPPKLLLISLLSIALGGYVLFFAEFRGSGRFANPSNTFSLLRGIVSTYAIALLASATSLFFFGRLDGESLHLCLAQIIVLSMAASLGASAGRLLLQSGGNSNG